MIRLVAVLGFLLAAHPVFAEKGIRVSLENILTGPAVGTRNLYAFQLEMELFTLGPVDLGWSIRKEGPGAVEGFGFGVHASRHWQDDKRVRLVTQAGVRFLLPGVEYSTFRFRASDGQVQYQRWERISTNFDMPFTDSIGAIGAWAPNLGIFAETAIGPVCVRAGIRATFHRYGLEIMQRPSGGDLQLTRNDRFFRVIFAPTIAIGF